MIIIIFISAINSGQKNIYEHKNKTIDPMGSPWLMYSAGYIVLI